MKNEDDEVQKLLKTLAAMAVDAIRASVLLTVLDNLDTSHDEAARTPCESSGHVANLREALNGLCHATIPSISPMAVTGNRKPIPMSADEAIASGGRMPTGSGSGEATGGTNRA